MGLDVYLYRYANLDTALAAADDEEHDPPRRKIKLPSATHPDHYWKIGYFRSSYNESGIDRILRDRIGTTLSEIMGVGDSYVVRPDWSAAKARGVAAHEALTAWYAKNGNVRVIEANSLDTFTSERAVLAAYLAENPSQRSGWWSNHAGLFFCESQPKILGAFTGKNCIGVPCAYLVIEGDPDGPKHHLSALEILVETCDYAMADPDVANLALHWSS